MEQLILRQAAIDAMAELQGSTSSKGVLKGISKAWKRIEQLPPIQPTDNLQKLADEIASFKRCVKSDNSDYLTGYLCALSVVEGMIADMRQKGENSESN